MNAVIRQATPFDASEILLLCMEQHGDAHPLFGPMNDEKIRTGFQSISGAVTDGFAFVATLPETGEVVGSVGGIPSRDWWSGAWVLMQAWWYVRPAHRRGLEPAAGLMRALVDRGRQDDMPVRFYDIGGVGAVRERGMRRMMKSLGFEAVGSTYMNRI